MKATIAWSVVALLLFAPLLVAPSPFDAHPSGDLAPGAPTPPLVRLLGPFSRLAAGVQWIRFENARSDGHVELAIARAETAVSLAPHATGGWDLFASYLGLTLASREREPDPQRRLHWLEAGCEVTRRGQAVCDDPASLAFLRGLMLASKAELDPGLPWPGGPAGLWESAAEAYAEADALGWPDARAGAEQALERAGALER